MLDIYTHIEDRHIEDIQPLARIEEDRTVEIKGEIPIELVRKRKQTQEKTSEKDRFFLKIK